MSIDRTAETPGDGNPQANARGRVFTMDAAAQPEGEKPVEVADLRSCTFNALVLLSLCFGEHAERPEPIRIQPPTVTIQIQPPKKK